MLHVVRDPIRRRKLLTGVIIVSFLIAVGLYFSQHRISSGQIASPNAQALTTPSDPTPSGTGQSQSSGELPDPPQGTQTAASSIGVDVIGAVQQPGLYFLPAGARVQDAVVVAGGLAPNANREAINLSAHLADGQQLRVPRVGEAVTAAKQSTTGSIPQTSTHININTADLTALMTLSGIGHTLAQHIIDYRTTHGPFVAITDLHNVAGIHASLFEKIKDRIQVNDAP